MRSGLAKNADGKKGSVRIKVTGKNGVSAGGRANAGPAPLRNVVARDKKPAIKIVRGEIAAAENVHREKPGKEESAETVESFS